LEEPVRQSGQYRISASRDVVWLALIDPDVLVQCIDGCQSMSRVGHDAFEASVRAKIGPLSAVFAAEVKLTELDPPESYSLHASVKGAAAGFGKGHAKVKLAEDGGATVLSYEIDGTVGGKLAQVGQRLIDGVARKMADDFFAKFSELMTPAVGQAAGSPAVANAPGRSKQIGTATLVAAILVATVFGAILLANMLLR
jgi:carbon monoxide dehydrogenase subunit G